MYRRWLGWLLVLAVLSVMCILRLSDEKEREHRTLPGTVYHRSTSR